ncbi:hypothetical protein, partial [Rathayibacter sp. Leaf296]|uniref:hypothetical protein n=1 Tax=Rathayibacter sp. Leaf296 TaxID=1736327 RepID=UPI00138F0A2E
TAVGGGYFLSTDGTLYFNNTPLQTGVTTATGTAYGSTQQRVYYQDATGDQWVITYSNGAPNSPTRL